MSLATRCPYCSTTFRVTHDQLKLRGGLVRCGSCKEIFNGVEHLLPAAPAATPTPAPPPPAGTATSPSGPHAATPPSASTIPDSTIPSPPARHESVYPARAQSGAAADASDEPAGPAPRETPPGLAQAATVTSDTQVRFDRGRDQEQGAPTSEPLASQPPSENEASSATAEQPDPLTRMTLMDIRPDPDRQQDQMAQGAGAAPAFVRDPDDISRAIEDLQSKPWRAAAVGGDASIDPIDALDNEEPAFVQRARQQQAAASKQRRWLASGSAILVLLALLQAAIAFRTPIAAQWPATLPALSQLCSVFGCAVGMPAQIKFITIESHELQAMPASDNTFTLGMLLRNRSDVTQTWPHLQLTLNDPAGEPVARRVLAPAQYLRPQDRGRGFAAKSEKPVRVTFALDQLTASGYLLYAFYP